MSEVIDPPVSQAQSPSTAMVAVRSALPTILAADKDDILGKLAAEIAEFEADVSTERGRKDIASMAHKVARTKMDLIRLGKTLTADWRAKVKAVNDECGVIEDRMDELKRQVRAPLDEFEARETRRVKAHEDALGEIEILAGVFVGETSAEITERLAKVPHVGDRDWQEFHTRAMRAIEVTKERLQAALKSAQDREAEQAELARLRAEAAERKRQDAIRRQREHEERIAAEAAEKARREAEAKAEQERLEAERRAQAEREAAERARQEAEAQAAREKAEAARREQEARDAARRAEEARIAAEERAAVEREAAARREREAAARVERERQEAAERAERERIAAIEQAEREKQEAVAAERRRQEAEAERVRQEEAARAADLEHRRTVNNQAVEDLMAAGVTKAMAIMAIKNIALGKVRHTSIRY